MDSKIALIVTGENVDDAAFQSALKSIPGLELQREQQRGIVTGALKVAKWLAKFVGESDKLADALIGEATKHAVGASIELQYGTTIVKISNANRSEIVALLDKAAAIAKGSPTTS